MRKTLVALLVLGCTVMYGGGFLYAAHVASSFVFPLTPVDETRDNDFGYHKDNLNGGSDANPFLGVYNSKHHLGEDWNQNAGGNSDFGDPIQAIANGHVVYAQDAGTGWGYVMIIEYNIFPQRHARCFFVSHVVSFES